MIQAKKWLIPTSPVKYLRILHDHHLNWSSQISQVTMKPTREIDFPSKLRKKANTDILKMVYHSHMGHIYSLDASSRNKAILKQTKMRCLQNHTLKNEYKGISTFSPGVFLRFEFISIFRPWGIFGLGSISTILDCIKSLYFELC